MGYLDFSKRPKGMSRREYAASQYGMNKHDFDFDKRPKGMSKREYAASLYGKRVGSGRSSSGGGGGGRGGTSYRAKKYKASDFVNTKPLEEAYDSAKNIYLGQLTALKPRYEELYKQLEAEKQLMQEKESQQFAEEGTQLKRNLAKRGIATDKSNQFYTDESGRLQKLQNMQSRETALEYAGRRLDIKGAESADERDLSTAVANLDLGKANTITNLITSASQTAAQLNSQEADRALAAAQWEKQFEFTKSEAAANRAAALYRAAKAETKSDNNAYNSSLSSLVASSYSQDEPAPYTRERVSKQLKARFPGLASRVDSDMQKFFPDGWEKYADGGGTRVDIENNEIII